GSVFAAFIGFLGGDDPMLQREFAKHLLTASILSAPAAIIFSKILLPQDEKVATNLNIDKSKIGGGPLEAISTGTTEGIKLAVNVGGMILVFIAFIALINYVLFDFIGANTGLNAVIYEATDHLYKGLNMQMILGYVFAPLAWVIGIEWNDIVIAGQLLGEKTVANEFIAYLSLKNIIAENATNPVLSQRSIIILTYALCGFSNFASIGIQIGGISTIAPNQRGTLAKLGIKALIGGTLACLMTATIAGIFIG
ncbi:MAG: CNT family concentrative nucleoside transporter, partial [Bacteroidia bacterium]